MRSPDRRSVLTGILTTCILLPALLISDAYLGPLTVVRAGYLGGIAALVAELIVRLAWPLQRP